MRAGQHIALRREQARANNRGLERPLGIRPGFEGARFARCQYLAGDRDDWRQCKAEAAPGRSYCETHHKLCTTRGGDRRPGEGAVPETGDDGMPLTERPLRRVRGTCCGKTKKGTGCGRAGLIIVAGRSWCWTHAPKRKRG